MQRVITLPLSEARCNAEHCARSSSCARHLLPAGQQGRPVTGFSASAGWSPYLCPGFWPLAMATPAQAARKVHPPIGSGT